MEEHTRRWKEALRTSFFFDLFFENHQENSNSPVVVFIVLNVLILFGAEFSFKYGLL